MPLGYDISAMDPVGEKFEIERSREAPSAKAAQRSRRKFTPDASPRIASWSSRPGEFHPEPLTDPDLTLNGHEAAPRPDTQELGLQVAILAHRRPGALHQSNFFKAPQSSAHATIMLKIEISMDEPTGMDAKERTALPQTYDFALLFDCNVHSIQAALHSQHWAGKIKRDQAVAKHLILAAVGRA
jgi:hypothetical protein